MLGSIKVFLDGRQGFFGVWKCQLICNNVREVSIKLLVNLLRDSRWLSVLTRRGERRRLPGDFDAERAPKLLAGTE